MHRALATEPGDVARDNEEQAILSYLDDGLAPAERAEARAALDALAALVHEVFAENGLTEDARVDRFDAARLAASSTH